jgi:hypothetical protein
MLTVELELFVTLTVLATLVVPTTTLLNGNKVGENTNGELVPPTPFPETLTTSGLKAPPKESATPPFACPSHAGLKLTLNVHWLFGAMVLPQGAVPPLTAEKSPLAETVKFRVEVL